MVVARGRGKSELLHGCKVSVGENEKVLEMKGAVIVI